MTVFVLLLSAAVFIGLQAAVFGRRAVARIRYTRRFQVPECYAGDTIELVEVIENHKWLPVPWIRVESMIDAALRFRTEEAVHIREGRKTQYHKSLFTLGPYRRIRRRHKITCEKRGVYRLSSVTVTGGDLFGLVDKTRQYPVEAELVVYPQVVALQDVPLPVHGWQGDVTVRRWLIDDPFTVAGVREYRSGDPMKLIHWKATARTGSLQVYRREYTAEQRLMVMLNVEDRETMRDLVHHEALIERGISYAATIVSDAIRRGIPAGFGHNGYRVETADAAGGNGPGPRAGRLVPDRGGNAASGRGGALGAHVADAGASGAMAGAGAWGGIGGSGAAGSGGAWAGGIGGSLFAGGAGGQPGPYGRVPIGGGREHLLLILAEMARIELRCRMLFHDFLEPDCEPGEEKRDYILITAHLSEPLRERIRRLEEAGHSVQVLRLKRDAEEVSA